MKAGFTYSEGGNVAVLAALVLPLIMLAAGGALDFQRSLQQRERLKDASDSLALRGAHEFLLANATSQHIKAVIDAAVKSGFGEQFGLKGFSHQVDVDEKKAEVSVTLTQEPTKGLFSAIFASKKPISLTSTALAQGGMKVCVVALEDADARTVYLSDKATLSAPECSVLSNATSQTGVSVNKEAKLKATMTCTAGGYEGSALNYDPTPTTDCPAYPDPLAKRDPPPVTGQTFTNTILGQRSFTTFAAALKQSSLEYTAASSGETTTTSSAIKYTEYTLQPGVYEGGITVASNASVFLEPGLYIIKDGPLVVDMQGKLTGEYVSFYFVGDKSTFTFAPDSKISLTAQKDGPLAGILMFEDRAAPENRTHLIMSDDARVLLGTIYLSRGVLSVSSLMPVADQSAYTVIVAKKLSLRGSPTLKLNTNYAATDIPVPEGVGKIGGSIRLRE